MKLVITGKPQIMEREFANKVYARLNQVAKVLREILEGKSYEEIGAKLAQAQPRSENLQMNV